MQDYQSGSINQQRLHQEVNKWNPKLSLALRVSGLGIILLLLPITVAVYNPDILRPVIKVGIPLQVALGLPLIGNAIQQAEVPQITVQSLKKLIDSKATDFILIDVREPEEYAIAHIPCSILVPLGEINHQALFNLIQTAWLAGILSFLVLDLYMYNWHLLMHNWALAWKFHRVHHTDKFMNISTSYRFHFVEVVASNAPKIFFIWILGIKVEILLIYELVFVVSLIFHHSNYHLSGTIDKLLSYAIITPNYHRIHHSIVLQESNSNYGSIFSLWDRLFKTFRYRQNPQDIQLGLIEDRRNLNIGQLIALPWEKSHKKK